MAGQYHPYATNQAWYSAEYNYYPSAGYSDGFQSRDYSSYGYNNGSGYNNYPDYRNPQANYPQYPQYFPLQQPVPPRQRTPTPPPPPAEPSAEYIAASLAPQPKSITPGQRKLLIFDLNGTLLLRSPRKYGQQRKIYLRPYAGALVAFIAHPAVRAWLDCMVWSSAQAYNVRDMVERVFGEGESTGMGYILRAVWARDTLGLGREAFHQKTQTTKDLAKPWAFFAAPKTPERVVYPEPEVYTPTSGAHSPTCYYRDAEYPPSVSPARRPSPPPSVIMPILHWPPTSAPHAPQHPAPTSTPTPRPPTEPTLSIDLDLVSDSDPPPYPHGPHTTLLVDDSPLKARLQPWNHLCVSEYDAPTRARDRAFACLPPDADPIVANAVGESPAAETSGEPVVKEKERWRKRKKEEAAKAKAQAQLDGVDEAVKESPAADQIAEPVVKKEKERRRKRKEEEAAEAKVRLDGADDAGETSADVSAESGTSADGVIVPRNQRDPQSKRSLAKARKRQLKRTVEAAQRASVRAEREAQQTAVAESASGSEGVSPALSPSFPPATVDVDAELPPSTSSSSSSAADGQSKKRKREAETEDDSEEAKQNDTTIIEAPPMPADGEPYDPTLLAVIGVLSHVRSVGNVAAWVRSGGLAAIVEGEPEEAAKDALVPTTSDSDANAGADPAATFTADPSQWFTSRPLLVAWAARGRAALAELGITANPGVQ
ncbi:hypothetical protein C8R46DRAFT_235792 [Mycena filopes]|nr:hypothetical protein C8R46DRAFT_235792 [Mycena filopes]